MPAAGNAPEGLKLTFAATEFKITRVRAQRILCRDH